MTDQPTAHPERRLGSPEYGTEIRRRVIAELAKEADKLQIFDREHGQMGRAQIIEQLASAAIGVLYPELYAWKAAARTDTVHEAADAIQAVIDEDRARFPRRSNDRAALGGARQIILKLIGEQP